MTSTLIASLSAVLLAGCASSFQAVATHYNLQDPCQTKLRAEGYRKPDFCGAAGQVIGVARSVGGQRLATITSK
jgi:hypothetical protein